ncbi:MAG: MBL fold metallo-hydrolase [Methanoregula sp.]|nr:MBL fold metallo-hydrolase [Methanoregula sp.]
MKIANLTQGSAVYTSNAYLLTGNWNAIPDVNTLIDTGRDIKIINAIWNSSTGVGKRRIDLVILTHTHYDHASMVPVIKKEFGPVVCGNSPNFEGIDRVLKDGERIRVADLDAEVIYTPGHSNDSLCLYCEGEGILFVGDTPIIIQTCDNTYEDAFLRSLEKIAALDVTAIYPGHGSPVLSHCNELIHQSLANVSKKS